MKRQKILLYNFKLLKLFLMANDSTINFDKTFKKDKNFDRRKKSNIPDPHFEKKMTFH